KVASDALRTFGASIDNASPSAMQDHLEGRKYDVVLVDRIGGASPMQGTENTSTIGYLANVTDQNEAVWVTASAFGLQTDRRDAKGSDLTVLASAGILGHSHSENMECPTLPAGEIGLKLVGIVMATAA